MVALIALLMVLGVAFYATAPETRVRLFQVALAYIRQARHEATRSRP
jgi:hypothetical protein